MRRALPLGLLTAALALTAGCGGKPTAPDKAKAGLDGGWTLVSVEVAGVKKTEADLAKDPIADRKLKATGDKLIGSKGGKEEVMSYKLNADKSPAEIDLTETQDGKTKTMYGIYKLDGDLLTICLSDSDKPDDRPKEFKAGADGKAMIMVLKKD
jgi:uncharacterized protein (TIGR03067 family)